MKILQLSAVLLLVAVAAVSAAPNPFFYNAVVPQFYVYSNQLVASPVVEISRTGPDLPCAAEGFYPHPINCSRFYRCVDFAGTSQFFSRYEFQCPLGQTFLAVGKNTCVPGDCNEGYVAPVASGGTAPGSVNPIHATGPVSDAGYPDGNPPLPVDVGGSAYPESQGSGATSPPPTGGDVLAGNSGASTVVGGGAYPGPGSPQDIDSGGVSIPTLPPVVGSQSGGAGSSAPSPGATIDGGGVYPQPVSVTPEIVPASGGAYPQPGSGSAGTVPAQTGGGAYPQPGSVGATESSGCSARFIQDPMYCNIYQPCPVDGNRYVCTAGAVFDQARQMCRLNDQPQDDVCTGKQMYQTSALFRSGIQENGPVPQQPLLSFVQAAFPQPSVQQVHQVHQQFPTVYQSQYRFGNAPTGPVIVPVNYQAPLASYTRSGSPANSIAPVAFYNHGVYYHHT